MQKPIMRPSGFNSTRFAEAAVGGSPVRAVVSRGGHADGVSHLGETPGEPIPVGHWLNFDADGIPRWTAPETSLTSSPRRLATRAREAWDSGSAEHEYARCSNLSFNSPALTSHRLLFQKSSVAWKLLIGAVSTAPGQDRVDGVRHAGSFRHHGRRPVSGRGPQSPVLPLW